MVQAFFIPPKDIRACREISRYRFKLVYMKASEKNRYQNSMTVSNIGLASVLSDAFGKTAQAIMEHVLASECLDEEFAKTLIRKSAKRKADQIIDSVRGCEVSLDQKVKTQQAKAHMDYLDEMIAKAEVELFVRMRPYLDLIDPIASTPGITQLSAAIILSEVGTDMSVFGSSGHLCSWAGLVPASNESAGKKKSRRVSRAGVFLKPLLAQCALAIIQSNCEPYFACKY
ncbi:transposase [Eggerthella guodeyinii]|uniref:Transposase n=1 Tax=Eggerthella guodeyinii TaxID=2690837 RepID=A0A6N7RRP4_9ACTN|nr:transposase [Eggerthella guodeyinii]MRX83677.1 transposase [Eggerthella guodeyinii]